MKMIQTYSGRPLTTSVHRRLVRSTWAAATVSASHLPIRPESRSRRRTISG